MDTSPGSENRGWFPQTSWSCVQKVQGGEDKAAREAIETLCADYRAPIVTAFRCKHGFSAEEAEDSAQDFIVWLLDSGVLDRAERREGRFRSFLLTCLDNFALNRRRKLRAERRGGKAIHVSIHPDSESESPGLDLSSEDSSPTMEIDLAWARATLKAARARLKAEENAAGRGEAWSVMREFLSASPKWSPSEAALRLIISEGNLKVRIHRLRQRFHEILTEQVSATVSSETEFEEEMRFMREVYS